MVCLCALFTYVCNVISAPLLQFHVIFMAHITTIQLFIISCKLFYHIILNIAFEILPTVLEVIERCHSDVAHDHHKNSIAYNKRGRVQERKYGVVLRKYGFLLYMPCVHNVSYGFQDKSERERRKKFSRLAHREMNDKRERNYRCFQAINIIS